VVSGEGDGRRWLDLRLGLSNDFGLKVDISFSIELAFSGLCDGLSSSFGT
jgi:hypothetical protein